MNDADAGAHAMASPRENPRVAARARIAADDQHRFALVAMRRVEIVLGADAEAPESGIEPGLLQQRGTVAGRIDQHAAGKFSIAGADAGDDYAVLDHGRDGGAWKGGSRAPACDGPLGQKLKHAADVDHAQRGHGG